jgi:glycerol-3-phosphate dehydrogenase (NAD(P)+)
MTVAVLGAGAFGTALAVTLGLAGRQVMLWSRDAGQVAMMRSARCNDRRLPGVTLPDPVTPTADLAAIGARTVLLALPMQQTGRFLAEHGAYLRGRDLVACSKGIDLATLQGPVAEIVAAGLGGAAAILTGPSFAADIARGLPTALTLACADDAAGARLQEVLSTATLRLYRTDDTLGAELGGALKNVVAIAAGVVSGAQLGQSARAAIVTRGFAEMTRLAAHLGARPETLMGLSGLGDLVLTCTSEQSRNFRFGQALGSGAPWDDGVTVEGAATAAAATRLGAARGIEMPVCAMVAQLVGRRIAVEDAVAALMARPLKKE